MAVLSPGSAWPQLPLIDETGRAVSPSAREALVGFFKTTCPTCQLAWPFFDRIAAIAQGGGLSVLAVSQNDAEDTESFNTRLGVNLPTYLDAEPWPASNTLGIDTVPTFFRVAADGSLRDVVVGFDRQKMQNLATEAAILAGKPPAELYRPSENVPAIKPG